MSARELRSLQAGVTSPPKRGRKCGQSNLEATQTSTHQHPAHANEPHRLSTKRSKATTKSEDEGSCEGEPAAGKSTMRKGKGGGKKGKRASCVAYLISVLVD